MVEISVVGDLVILMLSVVRSLMRVEVSVWKLLLDKVVVIISWHIVTDSTSMAWKAVMWQLLVNETLLVS